MGLPHSFLKEPMGILLDILYALVLLVASPVVLFKMATSRRWRAGMWQRFGGVPRRRGEKPCVWIHAVSVGEVNTIRTLVEMMGKEFPGWEVLISTTTDAGQAIARERYGAARCFFLPLDFTFVLWRAFSRIRPDALVLVELEVWPNLLRAARRRGVPVVIINGRMREEKVRRYHEMRWLLRPALEADSPNLFCVQNEQYRDRFIRAGFPAGKVRVTGTMKYDAVQTAVPAEKVAQLRDALGLKPGERAWVAGCTWPGEEEICLSVHRLLQREAPELRLVIAPRHVERAGEVEQVIERAGFPCQRRSGGLGANERTVGTQNFPKESSVSPPAPPPAPPICLLDSVGELGYVYSFAEFVFVGKSLTVHGGHNMLEPAALGVVPVFGPLTENFLDEAQLLLSAQAALRVRDEQELGAALLRLLREPQSRADMARRGREAILRNRGASRRHLDILRELIEKAS